VWVLKTATVKTLKMCVGPPFTPPEGPPIRWVEGRLSANKLFHNVPKVVDNYNGTEWESFRLLKTRRSNPRGYLICTKCGGYYKLKEGEKPSDFVSCECGGPLQYYNSLEEAYGTRSSPFGVDESAQRRRSGKSGEVEFAQKLREVNEKHANDNRDRIIESFFENEGNTWDDMILEDSSNLIPTIQKKREEIKTREVSKDSKSLLLLFFAMIVILLFIIIGLIVI